MPDESELAPDHSGPPPPERAADAADLILAALDYLVRGLPADRGPFGAPSLARQTEDLRQWAERLGLLLNPSDLPSKVVRGGQEH